jgi:hypothetical protein
LAKWRFCGLFKGSTQKVESFYKPEIPQCLNHDKSDFYDRNDFYLASHQANSIRHPALDAGSAGDLK